MVFQVGDVYVAQLQAAPAGTKIRLPCQTVTLGHQAPIAQTNMALEKIKRVRVGTKNGEKTGNPAVWLRNRGSRL